MPLKIGLYNYGTATQEVAKRKDRLKKGPRRLAIESQQESTFAQNQSHSKDFSLKATSPPFP